MPWIAVSDPDLPRYCTPGNVNDDLAAMGLVMNSRSQRHGWRTLWAGQDDVRVDNPCATRAAHAVVAEQLAALGWTVELHPDWVRVSGMRAVRAVRFVTVAEVEAKLTPGQCVALMRGFAELHGGRPHSEASVADQAFEHAVAAVARRAGR